MDYRILSGYREFRRQHPPCGAVFEIFGGWEFDEDLDQERPSWAFYPYEGPDEGSMLGEGDLCPYCGEALTPESFDVDL